MRLLFGWRSLRKLMYFIKDIVFYIFIFALGFLLGSGIIKVKAEEIVDFNFSTTLVNENSYDFSEKLDEIENLLKVTGKEYVIILQHGSKDLNYYSHINIYLFDVIPAVYFHRTGMSISYSSYKKYIVSKDVIINEINLNLLINNIESQAYLNNYTNGSINLYSNNADNAYLYSTSFDIINTSSYTYRFNDDYSVKNNEKIYTLKTLPKKIQTYTENFTINTKNIDRIEYTFDFESEMNEASHFVHNFNFSTTFMNAETNKLELFKYPYLQYTKFDHRLFEHTYKLLLDEHKELSENQVVYYDTQLNPFTDIQSLKFVVDFDNINDLDDSSVFIHFDSNLSFTRKIIYLTDEDSRTKIYNVNDIDHIEVDFDLANIPNSALIPDNEKYFKFNMNFDIKTVTDKNATNLSDTTLDIPQIEYVQKKADGKQNISKYGLADNRKVQYNKYYDKDSYTNTYFANYEYNRSLKLIINCRDINDVYLYLFLRSNLEYEITVFYRDDVEDYQQYYSTIDLTSKYAALFMPRLRQNNDQTAVSSYFISNGNFQVEERDTYTDDYTLYKDPQVVNGTNQYYYFYTPYLSVHYNDSFYYKNLNYPNDDIATIKYDTRYFVVSVCKNEFECETITNPNTNEVISPKPPHDKNEWSFSKLIERVKVFVNNLHSTIDPIANTVQQFYNSLPGLLQNFLLVIYITFLLFALIKVLRR